MEYYELYESNPGALVLLLFLSLILTLFLYGAFPILYAKKSKNIITKKKYKIICYSTNCVFWILWGALNGAVSTGAAYILWTSVFCKKGLKILADRNLISEYQNEKNGETYTNNVVMVSNIGHTGNKDDKIKLNSEVRISYCRKCGNKLLPDSDFCSYCGTKVFKGV